MATGPKNRNGGPRPGAGRPRSIDVSDRERNNILKAAKLRAKTEGRKVEDLLMDCIYGFEGRDKIAALKLYYDIMLVKETKSEVTSKKVAEAPIILPASKPDPAKNNIAEMKMANG